MKIAIITGGETGEREISLRSAKNIKNLIDFAETEQFIFPEDKKAFLERYADFDLAIPVIHGAGGEDGSIQGLLKFLDIPFIFSDVTAHAIAIDKIYTKEIAQTLGIISPQEVWRYPTFVKPRSGGSSVASKLCNSKEELDALISGTSATDKNKDSFMSAFITEEPIIGREFTVGVIEHEGKTFPLPVIEIIPKGKFFNYENKYDPEKLATEVCPAEIDVSLSKELQRQALLMHTHLQVRHMSPK